MSHTVIRASAGSGKTFALTTRYLRLLMTGEPIDRMLGSTFSRKAAGEIIERVLLRLATASTSQARALELYRFLELPPSDDALPRVKRALLETCRNLHRMSVGTLDAFFMALAQSYGLELGFEPGWRIIDDALDQSLQRSAVREALESHSRDALTRQVNALYRSQLRRSVVEKVDGLFAALRELWLETDAEAWSFPVPDAVPDAAYAAALETLQQALAAAPDKRLRNALEKDVAAATARDWEGLVSAGLSKAIMSGDGLYFGKPIPPQLIALFAPIHATLRHRVALELSDETRAIAALLDNVSARYAAHKRALKGYGFSDIARMLSKKLGAGLDDEALLDVFFRLDQRIHHLLLDEFQDTSVPQWQVLDPLAQEITAHADGSRSFFCVGDVKQAIYAWRGGVSEIFDKVQERLPGVQTAALDTSRRSAPAVIDFTNRVFQSVPGSAALADAEHAARQWLGGFSQHLTVHTDMPGFVTVRTTHKAADGESQATASLRETAQLVADEHARSPHIEIGVLARRNGAVQRLIYELSLLGVQASEEGGNPLTDSVAVTLVTSLFRMADHPSDGVSRFHVATSPLGPLVDFTDASDSQRATALAAELRRKVASDGYGATVRDLVRRLSPACDERNANRLSQLCELAERYDAQAGPQASVLLRLDAFATFVAQSKMEAPLQAPVRVMTIHQSKGLEFDSVYVCDIDDTLKPSATRYPLVAQVRTSPIAAPTQVFRFLSSRWHPLFPEQAAACEAELQLRVREQLSNLYVAITRPRHALHVLVSPFRDNAKTPPKTIASVVVQAVAPGLLPAAGSVLLSTGDPDWARSKPAANTALLSAGPPQRKLRLQPARHTLKRATPSGQEGQRAGQLQAGVKVAEHLRLERLPALARGSVLHAWLEQIEWLSDTPPPHDKLRALAHKLGAKLSVDDELAAFARLLATPSMRALLSRPSPDARVYRELPFAVLASDDTLLTGSFDRVVVERSPTTRVTIIDYKTDRLPDATALAERVEYYRPQLDAYRQAAATVFRADPSAIRCQLVFLGRDGEVVTL